jgi:hypothetical protein
VKGKESGIPEPTFGDTPLRYLLQDEGHHAEAPGGADFVIMNLFRNDSGAVGVRVGPTKLYLWSGGWSIFDRSGASNFSLRQCACHRFTLFLGR